MPVDEEFLKSLPAGPGVYLMTDEKNTVLYVGKAANLRSRVRSYFIKGGDERPRIQFLMERVDSIRTILTDTEKEALILENNLIKQYRPKYNVHLRDDKSFYSLRLNVTHPFPRLTLVRTRHIKPDGERYFGPYSSARDARSTLKFILKLFPLRQCTERAFATCTRPCLNCQMKRCLCPCSGKVEREEYARMVEGVTLLLQGRQADLAHTLEDEMKKAAEGLRFEEAARIRDRITSITRTLEAQNVSFFHLKDQDVIALVNGEDDLYVVQVISLRRGKLLYEDSFVVRNKALEADEIMAASIKQYYGSGAFVPKEILISRPVENQELIESWLRELRGNKVGLRVPARGSGARLMALALKNARNALKREKGDDTTGRALAAIAKRLRLPDLPVRIEGYDIANIAGSDPVGAKVAFKHAQPDKSAYRKYTIRGFGDQDDPGMIHQVIDRRLNHLDGDPLPDLFLIDGGKSQLNAAAAALKDHLGDDAPPVTAIAKARTEEQRERVFIPNRKNPILFPHGDPGLMLLMRVRDESHRVVNNFLGGTRKKSVIRTGLQDVPGIGPKKRNTLLKAFGSLKAVLEASDEDLASIEGIGEKDVKRLRAHFAQPMVKPATEETAAEESLVFTDESYER